MNPSTPPEYNVTGIDYRRREHFRYAGPPVVDLHSHIMRTRPPEGESEEDYDALAQAHTMLAVAAEFGVGKLYSMCPPEDIPPLRAACGDRLRFIGSIAKTAEGTEDEAYRVLDRFLEQGVHLLKFWAAPRGRDRGLFLDAPWRLEAARRGQAAGIRAIMVHVADPDTWFRTTYADSGKFGTKAEQYVPLRRLLETFPDLCWVAAHLGGDPEHPDHLEALLEEYPHLFLDTSATKWQVREVSAHRDAVRGLMCRHPDRFLFGSDLVTRHGLEREHYVSRYWCQRALWESDWEGPSPIADPDYTAPSPQSPATPILRGLALPPDVLECVYAGNARRLLGE